MDGTLTECNRGVTLLESALHRTAVWRRPCPSSAPRYGPSVPAAAPSRRGGPPSSGRFDDIHRPEPAEALQLAGLLAAALLASLATSCPCSRPRRPTPCCRRASRRPRRPSRTAAPRHRRGRRQRRHPLVQPVQRPAVAARRPRRHRHDQPGRAATGRARTRKAFQIQTSADGNTWTDDLPHHDRHRRHPDPQRHRLRPLRADVRHRRAAPATATRCGSSRCTARRRHAAGPGYVLANPQVTGVTRRPTTRRDALLPRVPGQLLGQPTNLPDDPIVFPGLPGASHMHTFMGNTTTNASSTAVVAAAPAAPRAHAGRQVGLLDADAATTATS